MSDSWSSHAASIVGSLLLVATAWVGKNFFDIRDRTLKIEGIAETNKEAIKDLNRTQIEHGYRIGQTETQVDGLKAMIRELRESSERRFEAIDSKLEILPGIKAALESLAHTCEKIVPRPELDSRINSIENELRSLRKS